MASEPLPERKRPALKATEFAGGYASAILDKSEYDGLPDSHLQYLNCSFLSHSSGRPPTLEQLKKHAQALTRMILLLETSGHVRDISATDWLEDMHNAYQNSEESHQRPLFAVRNRIAEYEDATGRLRSDLGCPIHNPGGSLDDYMSHANELLETIDYLTRENGGLLSTLPFEGDPARKLARNFILGQWLEFTTALVERVASFEREVEALRIVMSQEAKVPMQMAESGFVDRRHIVYPQDRYVLSHLSDTLWQTLSERFDAEEKAAITKEEKFRAQIGSSIPPPIDFQHPRVVSVKCQSMIYRVSGERTFFVVPAYDIDPSLDASRKVLERPLVVTVPRHKPEESTAMERRLAAREQPLGMKKDAKGKAGQDDVSLQEKIANQEIELRQTKGRVEARDKELDGLRNAVIEMEAERDSLRKDRESLLDLVKQYQDLRRKALEDQATTWENSH